MYYCYVLVEGMGKGVPVPASMTEQTIDIFRSTN